MLRMIDWICGYDTAEVMCERAEDFLNRVMQQRLTVRRVRYTGEGVCFTASPHTAARLRRLCAENGMAFKMLKRGGLPNFFVRHRMRAGALAGALLWALSLWVSTLFVWRIDISGNEKVSSEEILARLQELGLHCGSYIPSIDAGALKRDMLMAMPSLSWIAVNLHGTVARVETAEARRPEKRRDGTKPMNIRAAADGVIEEIIVREGIPAVKKGDSVTEHSLLVSGVIDNRMTGFRLVSADASVRARTVRHIRAEVPRTVEEQVPTGQKKEGFCLELFGLCINLFSNSGIGYDNYDTMKTSKALSWMGIPLPAVLHRLEFSQTENRKRELSPQEAENEARRAAQALISAELGDAEILERREAFSEENGKCVLDLTLKCVENIAEYEEIGTNCAAGS